MALIPPQSPPDVTGVIIHFDTFWKIIAIPCGAVVALVVWAWRKMERNVEKGSEALVTHAESDEDIHDKLFTAQRATDEKLNQLIGEHKATHKGGTP